MGLKHSIPLQEPQWGKDLLVKMNQAFVECETTASLAPLLADGLVFTYPVLLLVWYIYGISLSSNELKVGALYVFTCAGLAAFVNIAIQYVIDKQRPEGYIDNADLLIMDHLPTAPFPSDHAAVSMAVGIATLLRAMRNGYTFLTWIGVFLIIGSVIMSLSRVGVAIHWPTDIIAGILIGGCVALLLHPLIYKDSIVLSFFQWLIGIQEWVFVKVGLKG